MTVSDSWRGRPCVLAYWDYKRRLLALTPDDFKITDDMHYAFHIQMPKSWSAKKKREMVGTPHRQTPDLDNLIKGLWDALLVDDKGIAFIASAHKVWAEQGEIFIEK
ncbi:MAG: RusA family crossover junction endodeoxyribonuclease [Thiomargarita sp.]|nr:RusA family crossover junction endodeoxyribonuclease [Thiomargarita sp.]